MLRGTALSFKVSHLLKVFRVPLDYSVHVKLPFCYGGLKQPSLQAFVEDFKNNLMKSNQCDDLKVSYDDDHPRVTKVSEQGALTLAAVQKLLDAALKADFFPEEVRARKAIAEMKWDAGEQEGKVWNRSLAQEMVVNLRGAFGPFSNVACGGFEHPMVYVTKNDLRDGSAPLPNKATFPITAHPSFKGLEPLHKSSDARRTRKVHFDPKGDRMADRPEKYKSVQRFCYFPFHFETSEWRLLKLDGLKAPEFDDAWRPFY